MNLAAYMYCFTVLIFALVFGMIDVNAANSSLQNQFESVRDANQSALYTVQEDYNQRKVLTTPQMMEAWLTSFLTDRDLRYEDITLNFVQIETDPPLFLVSVEGYRDDYMILTKDAVTGYYSGSTILE